MQKITSKKREITCKHRKRIENLDRALEIVSGIEKILPDVDISFKQGNKYEFFYLKSTTVKPDAFEFICDLFGKRLCFYRIIKDRKVYRIISGGRIFIDMFDVKFWIKHYKDSWVDEMKRKIACDDISDVLIDELASKIKNKTINYISKESLYRK